MDVNKKSFAERMIEKYPSLFEDLDGDIRIPGCGFYCPPGWEHIIDTTFQMIVWRVNTGTYVRSKDAWKYDWFQWVGKKVVNPILYFFDPLDELRWKNGKRQMFIQDVDGIFVKKRAEHPIKNWLFKKLQNGFYKFAPKYPSIRKDVPPVKIEQIKEKFGTLRIYYSGGDEYIAGCVATTETLSENICETSGAVGKQVTKNGWYKTLSEEEAKQQGFA